MSGFGGGSSGAGSLTQLLATGSMDAALTQNATRTFWKSSYQKHSLFALESINQPFTTQVQFGAESHITVNRQGDLAIVDVPQDCPPWPKGPEPGGHRPANSAVVRVARQRRRCAG